MQTLNQATEVKPIYDGAPYTPATITLPEGTEYETVSLEFDPFGFTVKTILVDGKEYAYLE